MSSKVRKVLRCVAYLVILVVIVFWAQGLLVPRRDLPNGTDRPNRKFEGFYAEPKDTIDVLFFGSSHMLDGISPMQIYEETGIRSFNFGTLEQPTPVAWCLLREAFNTQSPKVVVVDASPLFLTQKQNAEQSRWLRVIDGIPLTRIRFRTEMMQEFINIRADNKYSMLSAVLPIINYHENFTELNGTGLRWENADSPMYSKGHNIPQNRIAVTKPEKGIAGEKKEALKEDTNFKQNLTYLNKIRSLCEEHGCELILTKVPTGISSTEYSGAWTADKNGVITETAAEMGLRYIDIYSDGAGIDWSIDSADGGEHLNEAGALKVSHFMAEWLAANCDISTEAPEAVHKAWAAEKRIYDIHSDIALLRLTFHTEDFFTRISEGNYTVFCAVSGSLEPKGWTGEMSDMLVAATGAKISMVNSGQTAYALVSRDGENIGEKKNEKQCTVKGTLADGKAFSVTSKSARAGGGASILIGGIEYAGNNRGLYIISYDNDMHCVADIARIDSTSAAAPVAHNTETKYKNLYYQAVFDATRMGQVPEIRLTAQGIGFVNRDEWAAQTAVLQTAVQTGKNGGALSGNTAADAAALREILNAGTAAQFRAAETEPAEAAYLIRERMTEGAPAWIAWNAAEGAADYRWTIKELDGFPDPAAAFESGKIVKKGVTKETYLELDRREVSAGKWLLVRVCARAEGKVKSEASRYIYTDGMPGTPVVFPREGGKEGDTFTLAVRTDPDARGIAIAYIQSGTMKTAKEYTRESAGVTVYTEGNDMYWFVKYPFKAAENNLYRTTLIRVTEDGKQYGPAAESLPFAVAPAK